MELLLEKISAISQGSSAMPILKLRAEGHICRYIAIATDLPISVSVFMCGQRIQLRIRNKELSANDSPKFTCKDWEHIQQPALLKHFQKLFHHIIQQLPGDVKRRLTHSTASLSALFPSPGRYQVTYSP